MAKNLRPWGVRRGDARWRAIARMSDGLDRPHAVTEARDAVRSATCTHVVPQMFHVALFDGASDFVVRTASQLAGRVEGPFTFRFVLQPITAIVLGVRAARLHHDSWRDVWTDIGRLCVVAVVIDAIYQALMFGWFYPGQAVLMAEVLAVAPYLITRSIARRWRRT